uniref:Uncharacterized protein n=1 Tax=Arundo donax TaxID=35708 RepID=A0A0A9HHB3_ARUDO
MHRINTSLQTEKDICYSKSTK